MRALLLATLMLLAGCLGASPNAEPAEQGEGAPVETPFKPVAYHFDGEFLAGGLDEPQSFPFDVPNGTTEVAGLLTWSMPGAILDFLLLDPSGEEKGNGWGESDQHRYVTTTTTPVPGTWTAVIIAERGVDVHYAMEVEAREGEPFGPIERTYTVGPRTFAEVNLNMRPGDHFVFDWSSDAEVYFNVHFHGHGGTERPIEHRGTALAGNFTAPNTEVYSLLWRNEGVTPVEVTVSLEGTYRLHSMTRDASEAGSGSGGGRVR